MASRVGNYLLFETLGEGAFGKVKLGVHEQTGEQVAVKIMDKSDIKAQEMTMNVRREIAIMKALKHRNIVNLRQVLTSQSKLYIVMDLVTGGELFTKILKEGKLPETTARNYFQQLVDGIEYCHRRGVCHRDLKPENLLIDETTGELKITDFGLSAMKGASTTEELLHTQCGSPNYCAPEIIARHKQGYSGTKVDAWSCGIILFALLAGYLPFYDENTKVLYRMIQRDDVKFPKRFPPEAKDLILRLLHKEPEQRFTLLDVKKHPWFLIGYEVADLVQKSSTSSSPPSAAGRRKRRGHARKSSVDTAPRDFPQRKKSDGMTSRHPPPITDPLPPALPPGHPAPPAVIDVSSPRPMPMANRPPAPPPAQSPPKSPVAPSVAPPLAFPHASSPATPPSHHIPAPPTLFPPASPPSAPSPLATPNTKPVVLAPPSYPVPPYPGPDGVRRAREVQQVGRRDGPFGTGNDLVQSPPSAPVKQFVDGNHVPRFPPPPASMKPAVPVLPPPPPPMAPPSHALPRRTSDEVSDTTESSLPAPNTVQVRMEEALGSKALPALRPDGLNGSPASGQTGAAISKSVGSSAGRTKWNVNVPPPPPSYAAATPPVTTSPTLAEGDSSWRKYPSRDNEASNGANVSMEDVIGSKGAVGVVSNEDEKPLSLVERRKMLYNNMAKETAPAVAMHSKRSHGSIPEKDQERGDVDDSEPKSMPGMRFGDRSEMHMRTAYPTPEGSLLSPASMSADFAKHSHGSEGGLGVEGDSASSNLEAAVPADSSASNGVLCEDGKQSSAEKECAEEGDEISPADEADVPLKERLAAAVARYRRIFRLGAKIGITSSPSFTSNKDNGSDGDGDEESKKSPSVRSDFFSRAKGVTGAWGIILSQELEEDSDTEDDRPLVTEAELQAFSRLLDFWDNRRASANVPAGSEVILDDEDTSPLSEVDIANIQSLLQKLEPKPVEDEVTEIVGEGDAVSEEVKEESQVETPQDSIVPLDGSLNMKVEKAVLVSGSGVIADSGNLSVEGNTLGKDEVLPREDSDREVPFVPLVPSAVATMQSGSEMSYSSREVSAATPPPPPPPPPPPVPPMFMINKPRTEIPPPPAPPAFRALDNAAGGVGVPTPPPPPVILRRTADEPTHDGTVPSSRDVMHGEGDSGLRIGATNANLSQVGPPGYAAPSMKTGENGRRLAVTPSTVRDPFRPRPPPVYPLARNESEDGNSEMEIGATGPKVRIDMDSIKNGRGDSGLREKESSGGPRQKRKSSANVSDLDIDGRKTMSRDSGRMHSGASGVSDGSGGGRRRGHARTPSRDEHATRGLFAFNMFNRRKSSAMTSFESELAPEDCLLEIGKILVAMGCTVLMKKDENKMKCEAPIKHETLKISITCSQENNVSTVHLKKGRRDKSQVDAKEFYEFFQVVHSRFLEKVSSNDHD